jgi:hypothetical protein
MSGVNSSKVTGFVNKIKSLESQQIADGWIF